MRESWLWCFFSPESLGPLASVTLLVQFPNEESLNTFKKFSGCLFVKLFLPNTTNNTPGFYILLRTVKKNPLGLLRCSTFSNNGIKSWRHGLCRRLEFVKPLRGSGEGQQAATGNTHSTADIIVLFFKFSAVRNIFKLTHSQRILQRSSCFRSVYLRAGGRSSAIQCLKAAIKKLKNIPQRDFKLFHLIQQAQRQVRDFDFE